MAFDYATTLSRLRVFLMDSGSAVWADADLQAAIRLAVGDVSLYNGTAVTLSGLDGAGSTTISALLELPLQTGAAGYAATARAVDRAESFELAGEGDALRIWGEARLKDWRGMLRALYPDAGAATDDIAARELAHDTRVAAEALAADTRLATRESDADTRLATRELNADTRLATRESDADARKAAEALAADTRQAAEALAADTRQATRESDADTRLATRELNADTRQATRESDADARKAAEALAADTRQAERELDADDRTEARAVTADRRKTDREDALSAAEAARVNDLRTEATNSPWGSWADDFGEVEE